MICWMHLSTDCDCPNTLPNSNAKERADRFMALLLSPACAYSAPLNTIESALGIMSEIERRVEAGTLFGEAQR